MDMYKRQEFVQEPDGRIVEVNPGFWYSATGYIVKWSIITGIFMFFFLYFILGYIHARHRIKKGKAPLRYHRFLLPRHQRGVTSGPFAPIQIQQGYGQERFDPPPVYNGELPPSYVAEDAKPNRPQNANADGSLPAEPPSEMPLPPRVKTKMSNPFRWLNRR